MSDFSPRMIDDVLTFYANTHRFDSGAATDADVAPVWRIYEETTTTPIRTGTMTLLDSANTAGFYSGQDTLSAANGYEAGKTYGIYISATVNGIVGTMHHSFRIGPVHTNVVQWAGAVANVLQSGRVDASVGAYPGNTAQTGDNFARLGAPAGVSISADIAAVKTDTTAVKTKTDTLPSGIQKNTALNNFEFLMIDSTDHVSPKTGLTITATRSLDGAAFAACANSATEVANGIYKINLAAGDLNADVVTLRFTASGSDARIITIITEP